MGATGWDVTQLRPHEMNYEGWTALTQWTAGGGWILLESFHGGTEVAKEPFWETRLAGLQRPEGQAAFPRAF